jgi:hypothetical protein
MKKITSIVLLIAMLLSTLAFTSCYFQTYRGKETKFVLNYEGDGYIFEYMYLSEECDVVIPSEYKGLPVTEIAPLVFWNKENLKTLTIPATVTCIGRYAFSGCTNLEKIIFEEGSQLKTIEGCAFVDCSSLKDIELPESLEIIEGAAFSGCSSLESIHIPKNVNEINYGIQANSFEECTSLKSIIIDEENQTYTMEGNFIYVMKDGKKHIVLCMGGDEDGILRIPEDVDSFYFDAFATCKNVDTVYMHARLDDIPEVECAKEYIVAEDNPYFCSIDGVVYSKDKTELVYYPVSKDDKEFIVPSFVKEIGNFSFYKVKYLEKIIISDGVSRIGESAFSSTCIRSVELPKSIEIIDDRAFYYCESLEEMKYAGSRSDFSSVNRGVYWISLASKHPIFKMICANGNRYFWTGLLSRIV